MRFAVWRLASSEARTKKRKDKMGFMDRPARNIRVYHNGSFVKSFRTFEKAESFIKQQPDAMLWSMR
jgi:hypothetical protein